MRRAAAGVLCALAIAGSLLAFTRASQGGWAVDYVAFSSGARLAATDPQHLYDVDAQARVQTELLGYAPPRSATFPVLFVYPPFAAEMLRPLAGGGVGLQAQTDIFCTLLLLAAVLTAGLIARRSSLAPRGERWTFAILAGLSAPASYGVLLGQWSPLLALACMAALVLLDRDRVFLAGVVLAPVLIKPQALWLLVPVLLLRGEWRMLGGYVTGGLALALVSIAGVGFDGSMEYVRFILRMRGGLIGVNDRGLPALLARIVDQPQVITVLSVVCGAVALGALALWRKRIPRDPQITLACAIVLSLLTTGFIHFQDLALLAIPASVFLSAAPRRVIALVVALDVAVTVSFVWSWIPADTLTVAVAAALMAAAALRARPPAAPPVAPAAA